jgi:hypothetical protein
MISFGFRGPLWGGSVFQARQTNAADDPYYICAEQHVANGRILGADDDPSPALPSDGIRLLV